MTDITFMLTACNRVDLLKKTLDSFFAINTYAIKRFIAHNDGDDKMFRVIKEKYPQIEWTFSGKRIGYARSLDKLISMIDTEYIFSSEEDWSYYRNPGFIEKSLSIMESRPDIKQVWIRDHNDFTHPLSEQILINGIPVKEVTKGFLKHWNGYSWNPGLRRLSDIKRMFPNGLIEYADEIDQAKHVEQFDYKAVALVESSIKHSGWNRRSINFKP